jgi:hypothetical protein
MADIQPKAKVMASHCIKLNKAWFLIAILTLIIAGFTIWPDEIGAIYLRYVKPSGYHSMNDGLRLSESELSENVFKAEHGDANAAMKVFKHYAFASNNPKRANYFLNIAKKLGDKSAIEFWDKRSTPNREPASDR